MQPNVACNVPFVSEMADPTTHTVTISDLPELVAKFTLVEGNQHYGEYNAISVSSREVYIDTQFPR